MRLHVKLTSKTDFLISYSEVSNFILFYQKFLVQIIVAEVIDHKIGFTGRTPDCHCDWYCIGHCSLHSYSRTRIYQEVTTYSFKLLLYITV